MLPVETIAIVIAALAFSFICWLVLQNSGSSEVVKTFITTVALSLLLCLVSVWSHLKENGKLTSITTSTFVNKDDILHTLDVGMLLHDAVNGKDFGKIGFASALQIDLNKYKEFDSSAFVKNPANELEEAVRIYKDAIIYHIFHKLGSVFHHSWSSKYDKMPTTRGSAIATGWDSVPEKLTKKYSWTEIINLSGKQIFHVPEYQVFHKDFFDTVYFPKGTNVRVYKKGIFDIIEFKNSFCTLEISVMPTFYISGIGKLKRWFNIDESKWATLEYQIEMKVSYSKIYSGSKRMPMIIRWAETIEKILKEEFEIDFNYEKARQEYMITLLEEVEKKLNTTPPSR